MKRILIPTDFTVESLNTMKLALSEAREKTAVVLMHAEMLTDSITELLFYSRSRAIKKHLHPDFEEALSILKNRFEGVLDSVCIELFHGLNSNSFRSFAEAKDIDLVYIPANYQLVLKGRAFDPIPLIKSSKIPYKQVEWDWADSELNAGLLNLLFS
jgi:hypothetical protein